LYVIQFLLLIDIGFTIAVHLAITGYCFRLLLADACSTKTYWVRVWVRKGEEAAAVQSS
jgi:hypothetical protein